MEEKPSVVPVSHPVTKAPQVAVLPHPVQNEQQQPLIAARFGPYPAGWSSSDRSGIKQKGSEGLQPATGSTLSPPITVRPRSPAPLKRVTSQGVHIPPWTPGPPRSRPYRPLYVKGALSYLDLVKIELKEHPDMYNRFLGIMKDLKSQTIDTLVILRIMSLFTSHPVPIHGFNTFLPLGYRIARFINDDGQTTITVTGPSGIHSQTPDGIVRWTSRGPDVASVTAESAAKPGYRWGFCDMPTIDLMPSPLPPAVNSSRTGQMHSMRGETLRVQVLQEEIIFENEIQPFDSRGHFCDLFLGTHRRLGRVALKRLRHRGGGEDEVMALSRNFQRETEIWLGLHHERILKCLGGFTLDGHLFIVSPFMKNGSLYDWLRSGEHIGRERLRLIHELASALVYLHSSGIIHGDVKANNVLLSDDGHVQLCDFGLTKLIGSNTTSTLKGAGSIRWQGPELWGNEPKTFKSDVYAFAMTIVEVLTSEIPFAGSIHDTAVLIAVYALDERPARVPEVSPDGTSYAVAWDVAERCWPKDVDQRIHMNQAAELLLVDKEA